jgi:hypothetical protein
MGFKEMGWDCRGYIYLCEIGDFHGGDYGNGHCRGYDAMCQKFVCFFPLP